MAITHPYFERGYASASPYRARNSSMYNCRMPQTHPQKAYNSKIFWGSMPSDPPSRFASHTIAYARPASPTFPGSIIATLSA